jgi:hypothetical protein
VSKQDPNEPIETIEQPTALDEAEIAAMYGEPDGHSPADAPNYHPILQIWRDVLKPAAKEKHAPITPTWANRITGSYRELNFADMPQFQERYFDLLLELAGIVEAEIATDDECLSYSTPEEDVEHNSTHYKNVLRDWQLTILRRELEWKPQDADAAVELAVISEIHKFYFGSPGQEALTAFLENIRFEFTEADQAELAEALNELRAEYLGGADE